MIHCTFQNCFCTTVKTQQQNSLWSVISLEYNYSKELGSSSLGGVVRGWGESVLVGHFEVQGVVNLIKLFFKWLYQWEIHGGKNTRRGTEVLIYLCIIRYRFHYIYILFVYQRTPMDVAVERGHVVIAEVLREAGNAMTDVSTISFRKYAPSKKKPSHWVFSGHGFSELLV